MKKKDRLKARIEEKEKRYQAEINALVEGELTDEVIDRLNWLRFELMDLAEMKLKFCPTLPPPKFRGKLH